jgi:dienelactone hydrolase
MLGSLVRLWRHVVYLSGVAWPGVAVGAVLAVTVFMADMALSLRSGLGTLADLLIVLVGTALGLGVVGLGVIVVRLVLRSWPAWLAAGLLSSFVFLYVVLEGMEAGPSIGVLVAAGIVVLSAALGGAIALLARRSTGMGPGRRMASWLLLLVSVAGAIAAAVWLAGGGTDPYVALQQPRDAPAPVTLQASDPSQGGRHAVRSLFYGSGTDRRRPEYRSEVSLRTEPVDASVLLENLKGFKGRVRGWYWGFGGDAVPLNGRVWYPEGDGPFPLVLVVHGNHQMEQHSDPGYAYLGRLLASRGFIVASVDENFLNTSWSGDLGGEMVARGYLLLRHLAEWRRWNATPGTPFHRRVDMSRIALIGHSRGGEAILHAAALNRVPCLPIDCHVRFDFGFSIQALVALAPIDGSSEDASEPPAVDNVSYLVLHGSHDGDVSSFEGLRAFKRARFTDGRDRFKAAVYVYRANHGQFNTVWGNDDMGPPFSRLLLKTALLGGAEQRRVAEVFVSGFLEAALNGRAEYVPMFRDVRTVAAWLPRTRYVSQFENPSFEAVADFDQGLDLSRGTLEGSRLAGEHLTVWRQGPVMARSEKPIGLRAVYLGWNHGAAKGLASYRITLPETAAAEWRLDAKSRLVLVLAATDDEPAPGEPVDFTVEATTSDGVVSRVPLSQVAPLPPTLRVRFTKWGYMDREFYRREAEPVFQTCEIPLALFARAGWTPARLRDLRLVFDRTRAGVIMLNAVGFSR